MDADSKLNLDITGKKIFLLYPHSVIQDEMLDILIMAGFEAYVLHDHRRASGLLRRFPASIMFINIDHGFSEPEWEAYIRGVLSDPLIIDCRLGILSYNTDQTLMRKYLMDLALPCGYVQLKLGVRESTGIMLSALEANEARGRRKFIRADCSGDHNALIEIRSSGGTWHGKILDISAAGIAAHFDTIEDYPANTQVKEARLSLHGSRLQMDMTFMGRRADKACVLLFTSGITGEHTRIVHRFIKNVLRRYLDSLSV